MLIRKLEHYWIRGIANDWFCFYFGNRKQFVSIYNHNSTTQTILAGVPQGSVLSPLYFFFYIIDLHSYIKFSRNYHFADNKTILRSDKFLYTLVNEVNPNLKNLSQWLKSNKLSLTLYRPMSPLYRNLSVDFLLCKSTDWFLYNANIGR